MALEVPLHWCRSKSCLRWNKAKSLFLHNMGNLRLVKSRHVLHTLLAPNNYSLTGLQELINLKKLIKKKSVPTTWISCLLYNNFKKKGKTSSESWAPVLQNCTISGCIFDNSLQTTSKGALWVNLSWSDHCVLAHVQSDCSLLDTESSSTSVQSHFHEIAIIKDGHVAHNMTKGWN